MTQNTPQISRRSALTHLATFSAAVATVEIAPKSRGAEQVAEQKLKGNIHHSVCKWCYDSLMKSSKDKPAKMSLEDFCRECKRMGLESVELLGPSEWPVVQKLGMICAMCTSPDHIQYGWNRIEHHDDLLPKFEKAIPEVASFGFPNIITFSGNRNGMSDEEGMENCVKGLKRLVPIAEKHKVTVCLELLNSRHDHKDYMCDHSAWGVEVVKRVGSERLKLLYDIYHMQIMEGDLIARINEIHPYIGHFHTGGVPGRHEIDETQETNYPAVMRAIVATGYKGYVSQEFVPKGSDPLQSLRRCVQICDV